MSSAVSPQCTSCQPPETFQPRILEIAQWKALTVWLRLCHVLDIMARISSLELRIACVKGANRRLRQTSVRRHPRCRSVRRGKGHLLGTLPCATKNGCFCCGHLSHLPTTSCLPQPKRTKCRDEHVSAREVQRPRATPEPCSDERDNDQGQTSPEEREAASRVAHGVGEGFGCPAVEDGVEGGLD